MFAVSVVSALNYFGLIIGFQKGLVHSGSVCGSSFKFWGRIDISNIFSNRHFFQVMLLLKNGLAGTPNRRSSDDSQNPLDCKLVCALNYYPKRPNNWQPSIGKLEECGVWIYLYVQTKEAWLKELLSETDGPMSEVFTQVFTRELFPNLEAMITLEGPADVYFTPLFPDLVT